MVAPVYSTDLTTIATGDEASGWVQLTGTDDWGDSYNGQGSPVHQSPNHPKVQGNYSVSQECTVNSSQGSLAYSAGAFTVPADGGVFVWQNYDAPDELAMQIAIGSGIDDFYIWIFEGGVAEASAYGGFINNVVNPTVPNDFTAGIPSGTLDYVGSAVYINNSMSVGRPHQCDAIRYGRGSSIFEFGEGTNGFSTLDGFVAQNDSQANRWGLIQKILGGYLYKGHLSLGSAANATRFVDSDKHIIVDYTPHVTANFNTVEVFHALTKVTMTRFTFTNLQPATTASRARWLHSGNAEVDLNDCIFNDWASFAFSPNTTLAIIAFNRCKSVTQNGARITGALFLQSDDTTALVSNNLSLVTESTFVSSGTGHAVEITAVGEFDWNNIATGYANTFGSTGNEIIYNNSGGAVVVVYEGGTVLTVRNGVGATTEVKDANPAVVDLGDAASWGGLATGAITGIGTCEGDIGALVGAVAVTIATPAPAINYGTAAPETTAAQTAFFAAVADIDSRDGTTIGPAALEIGGTTLGRGVYDIVGAATMTTPFTLDGEDDPDSVFIIRCGAAFSVTAAIEMQMINGAQAKNVFWRVVGAVALGAGAYVEGTFLGHSTFGFGAGADAKGRILMGNTAGTITFSGSTLENPDPGVTLTMIANISLDGAEVRVYDKDTITGEFGTELSGIESNSGDTYNFVGGAGSQNNVVWIQILLDGYIEFGQEITIPESSGSFFPVLIKENN